LISGFGLVKCSVATLEKRLAGYFDRIWPILVGDLKTSRKTSSQGSYQRVKNKKKMDENLTKFGRRFRKSVGRCNESGGRIGGLAGYLPPFDGRSQCWTQVLGIFACKK
jgi:hypothetical protein